STKSVWARVGKAVDRRPAAFIVGTLLLLGVMSVGNLRVETGLSQSEQFLQKPEAITALERLGESFPAGASDPAVVITESDGEQVAAAAMEVAGVSSAAVSDTAGELTAVDVVIDAEPGSDEAADVIRDLRVALEGTSSWVGGTEAQALDTLEGAQQDQRTVIPLIVALVLGILLVLLRSIVAPIILVATVVATWFAALGASWWVFAEVLGFQALDATVPLLTFLFLVALGVDYNIFLVTRAGEEAKRFGTRRGMLRALTSTGGVITSAGILLAAVFATLGVLPLVVLGQIGVIICVGVLLDTLVVRTVLVPAIAIVLGDRFWWPRKIRREEPAPPAEGSGTTSEEVPVLVG
nr:MMPL family transporter [Actinomycetales bacterium]